MDRILDTARGGQNVLERLMNALPGFKGYREKELRRDADRLQREHLAARLDLPEEGPERRRRGRHALGRRSTPSTTSRPRASGWTRVSNRIRYADRGYARLLRRR